MTTTLRRARFRFAWMAGVILCALVMSVALTAPAHADAVSTIDPDADTSLVLHKMEQPEAWGQAATGLPLPSDQLDTMTPIGNVNFEVYRVPGIDLTTPDGWAKAQTMTISQAWAAIGEAAQPPAASGITADDGLVEFDLGVGLYYVREMEAPPGVVRSIPFLVALPTPHPTTNEWLYTVHVYPKNARVWVERGVVDANTVHIGQEVKWYVHAAIPHKRVITGYKLQTDLDPRLQIVRGPTSPEVMLMCNCDIRIQEGEDFELSVEGQTISALFTEAGRVKLARARDEDPEAYVHGDYMSRILGPGIILNEVTLYPSARAVKERTPAADSLVSSPRSFEAVEAAVGGTAFAIEEDPGDGAVSAYAETKFGPLAILVIQKDHPDVRIEGAKFKLYLSPQDALADRDAVEIEGVNEWVSDAEGRLTIQGLRFSNFADGIEHAPTDPLFRYYYVRMVEIPPEWEGRQDPMQLTVTSYTEAQVALVELWVDSGSSPSPGPDPEPGPGDSDGSGGEGTLPKTGAQVAGAALLAVVLMGVGALMVMRRRRDDKEDSALLRVGAESGAGTESESGKAGFSGLSVGDYPGNHRSTRSESGDAESSGFWGSSGSAGRA